MRLDISAQLLSISRSLLNHQVKNKTKHKTTVAKQEMKIKKNCQGEIKTVATPQRIHEILEQVI